MTPRHLGRRLLQLGTCGRRQGGVVGLVAGLVEDHHHLVSHQLMHLTTSRSISGMMRPKYAFSISAT